MSYVKEETLLFPDLPPVVMAALLHGLPGAPAIPDDPDEWSSAAPVIVRQKLTGLALSAARSAGVALTPPTLEFLRAEFGRETARVLSLEAAAPRIQDIMTTRAIPSVFTKGIGIARAYRDPSHRTFVDLDLLVPHQRFTTAVEALHEAGFEEPPSAVQPRTYFNRVCREAVNLVHPGERIAVDLHHHVPPWIWGSRIAFRDIVEKSQQVPLATGSITTPSILHNFLIATLHVISDKSKPGQSLLVWRDVLTLAGFVDPSHLASVAARSRLGWLIARVLNQIPEAVRPEKLLDVIDPSDATPADQWRLRRLLPPGIGSRMLAPAFRLPAPQAAAYLVGYFMPSRQYLRAHHRSAKYRDWWSDAIRDATGR